MIMAGRARMLDDTRRGWKKEAMARCHEIVARTEDGQRVTGEDDVGFLHCLLDRHPRASQKIGVGVASFTVQPMERGTRGFVLHRYDGSSTDFSYYSCITPPNDVALARKAMRRAVDQQISEFRKASAARGPLVCEVTGEALTWDDVHVDHAPPIFVVLADEWAVLVGGYQTIQLLPAEDKQIGRLLADPEPWADFHRARAHLRIVSRLMSSRDATRTGTPRTVTDADPASHWE
jgi:Protein of unknown function (DUF3223)